MPVEPALSGARQLLLSGRLAKPLGGGGGGGGLSPSLELLLPQPLSRPASNSALSQRALGVLRIPCIRISTSESSYCSDRRGRIQGQSAGSIDTSVAKSRPQARCGL